MDNITAKTQYDGVTTPVPATSVHTADELNDRIVEQEGSVTDSGQSLDAADAGQQSKAMFANGVAAQSMLDSGGVNSIVLTPITGASGLRVATPLVKDYSLLDGAIFSFKANNTNTGNMTVNVGQASPGGLIGSQPLFLEDGTTEVPAGQVVSGTYYSVRYDPSLDVDGAFILLNLSEEIIVSDEKASGVDGGSSSAGVWATRDLNTVKINTIGGASLSSDQITLPAGTYKIKASAPANNVNKHKVRLQNITDATTIEVGTSINGSTSSTADITTTHSCIDSCFTITGTKVIELQHRCELTVPSTGFGSGVGFGVAEVYSLVNISRVR